MRHILGRSYAAREITVEDIHAIMQVHPTLSSYGFGTFGRYHREYRDNLALELQQSREQLLASVKQCSDVCDWLYPIAKTKKINKRHTSYGLKHYVERITKCSCTNGAFIVAAIYLGFRLLRCGSAAYFNLDQMSLERQMVVIN